MLETLDAAAVRRWCGGGLASLRLHQHEIDELNVYPVPDGDTGTNLVLTLASAQQALEEALSGPAPVPAGSAALTGEVVDPADSGREPTPLGRALRRMARGALLGARGNSGVIVSQILRGMADSLATAAAVRGGELARALRSASEAAYAAVARPVEGTVLSVVAAAADGAGRIKSDDLVVVARAAARAASEALARTPQQLPVLARAGVVDAGGRGLCLLLDALVEALTPADPESSASGGPAAAAGPADSAGPSVPAGSSAGSDPGHSAPDRPDPADGSGGGNHQASADPMPAGARPVIGSEPGTDAGGDRLPAGAHPVAGSEPGTDAGGGRMPAGAHPMAGSEPGTDAGGEPDEGGILGYEVQYLLQADQVAAGRLRTTLDELGDSLVVVGDGDGTWNVHVHVPAAQIGPAVEAGIAAGRPHRITVTPLLPGRPHAEPVRRPVAAEDGRAAVVVAAGDGLTALFEAEGATVVGRNPSIREMIEAIAAPGAGNVVLLPNDANTHAVASAAAREAAAAGIRVSVVPTRSPVQALAALAVRDRAQPFADDVIAMAEAAGACRYGEVCTAQRDSLTVAGPCRAGDLLGLVDGEVHVIGADLEDVSRRLLDRMLGGGGELATLVLGADAPAVLEGTLRGHVTQSWPFVELQCYAGGQPRYHLLVGVE